MIYGYIRVSTQLQDIEKQKLRLLSHAQKNHFRIDEFIEVQLSSQKNIRKRRIQELLDKLKKGDTVVATEVTRVARSMREIFNFIAETDNLGVSVIFIQQPELSLTSGPMRSMLLAINGYLAEAERQFCSDRTKGALKVLQESGVKLGRPRGRSGPHELDNKANEIRGLLRKRISVHAIAKILEVPNSSLQYYVKTRGLM